MGIVIGEKMNKVKQIEKFDVVVAGGGPAGIAASIAAARHGQKTVLIEVNGCVGGTSTAGALPFWPESDLISS